MNRPPDSVELLSQPRFRYSLASPWAKPARYPTIRADYSERGWAIAGVSFGPIGAASTTAGTCIRYHKPAICAIPF